MIRYILVDDNQSVLHSVKTKIEALPKDYDLQHIKSYDSSKQAFEEVNESDYDLLIVDFEMPVYNGLELAQKIGRNKKIIFLTSTIDNEKRVINTLDISGYLSKPFDIDEFEGVLKNKIIGEINTKHTFSKKELLTIAIGVTQDIGFYPHKTFYISSSRNPEGEQANKNCVHFFGKQDKVIIPNIRISINELSKKLKPYGFEKINQSTIVNLSKINKRYNKVILLKNSEEEFIIADLEKTGLINRIRTLLSV